MIKFNKGVVIRPIVFCLVWKVRARCFFGKCRPVAFFGQSGVVVFLKIAFFVKWRPVVFCHVLSCPVMFCSVNGVRARCLFWKVRVRCLFWKVWTPYRFGKSGPVAVLKVRVRCRFGKSGPVALCIYFLNSIFQCVHERLEHLNLKQILNNLRDVLLFKADLCS
jgi:hypothetical protein